MNVFFEVVLPVLLVFAVGYLIQKWRKLDIKSVSTVALYIFTPGLVFETFYEAELNGDYINMLLFSAGLLLSIILINKLFKWVMNYSQTTESGLVLSTAFMNSGNYGTPIILFAFGQEGFNYSVSFMVLQAMIMNFFGVYYAARGEAGMKLAIKSVFKMPPTYAVIVALIFNLTNTTMPQNIFSSFQLIADAAIPGVMIVLGMQLAEISVKRMEWGKISYAMVLRLLISPLIAFGLVQILPINDLLGKVLIISAAMPSAATTTMFAVQFDTEPEFVSGATLVTTLVSILTITGLLSFMA